MNYQREESLDYDALNVFQKFSIWLGTRQLNKHLSPGSWLDLLSGNGARLQASLLGSKKINEFHALDAHLDKELSDKGFKLTEHVVDKTLPFADSTFDNVTVVNGLEHLWHPQEILQESFRILKPGGVLQIVVPTWFAKPILEFFAFTIKDKPSMVEMSDHKLYYDEKTLWPMLIKAGFKPGKVKMKRIKFFCSLYTNAVKS